MDKFELESFSHVHQLAEQLESCFIDDDAYSRTPSPMEWRSACKIVHQIVLACCELLGYANATRMYRFEETRGNLSISGYRSVPIGASENDATIKSTDEGEPSGGTEQGFVEFTKQEIKQMPNNFRRLIIVDKKRCHMRKRTKGNSTNYEIRFRSDGYNISACGKTIELAKANMLEKLKTAKPKPKQQNTVPIKMAEFAFYYYEKFRRPKLAELTYAIDLRRIKCHIVPTLGPMLIEKITPSHIEALISELQAEGKSKTATEIYSILSTLFKGAIAHGIIERNPLLIVPNVQHIHKHGSALTREEENALFERVKDTHFEIAYALALYCGLRPNEVSTATVQGDFIVSVNSKQHRKGIFYKKIPICKRLAAHLEPLNWNLANAELRTQKYYSIKFPSMCPGHKLYDLRTTFYSRAQELGVAEPALKAYMGHSNGKLGNAYTDLSESYLLKEGDKLNEW